MLSIKAPAVGKAILVVAQDLPEGRKELGLEIALRWVIRNLGLASRYLDNARLVNPGARVVASLAVVTPEGREPTCLLSLPHLSLSCL